VRTRLQSRLTLSYLTVLLLGMGLAGLLAWLAVEQLYLNAQRDNLLAQARLTAAALQGAPLPESPVEPYVQTANVVPGIHTRILGQQGAVVVGLPLGGGDAQVQVPTAENAGFVPSDELRQRPEIQQAMQGQAATAVRRVAAAGNRRVLYAAAPILAADGSLAGIAYVAMPLPATGLPSSAMLQFAGAVLAAILLAGVAGTLLARRLARPLVTLARAAEAVSAGNLGQPISAESDIVELHSLGEAFNAMTASLRRSEQAKNAFLADVTHELRTPLTVIKGTIETLEDGALDDAEGRLPLLASMERETDRLIRMVNELLVLTRADAGALRLNLQALDMAPLARARCDTLAPLAARRQVGLRVAAAEEESPVGVFVLGDADRLAQVLDNLLDNAIRHAPDRSTVTVTLTRAGDEVQCSVHDPGPGIPAEHLPLIFERFYRVDAARDRASGGAGLGLAIARALITAQGGRIGAQSAAGQGTSITFSLPAAGIAPRLPES
jgi:two-component system sensor histidine kinase BaeS